MARMPVVLIDDVRRVREAVAELLRNAGHEIVGEADDGASGVRETVAHRLDLGVMDWRLPGMDGVEATRRIHASCPRAPIVAFCSAALQSTMAVRMTFVRERTCHPVERPSATID